MRRLILIAAIVVFQVERGVAGVADDVVEKLRPVAPCAAAIAAAEARRIPLNQIDAGVEEELLNPG